MTAHLYSFVRGNIGRERIDDDVPRGIAGNQFVQTGHACVRRREPF
jgi:hypothetical protein